MAVKAAASITLSAVVDVTRVTRWYILQSSTMAKPVKPSSCPPGGSWDDAEPGYTSGSTNSLYFTDCTEFSDGSWAYSEVSLSSSYEAAKQAYNKAAALDQRVTNNETAITQTQQALSLKASQETVDGLGNRLESAEAAIELVPDQITLAVDGLEIGGTNLLRGTGRGVSGFSVKNAVGGTVTTYDFNNPSAGPTRRYTASGAVTNLIVAAFPTYVRLESGREYILSTKIASYSKAGYFRFFYSDDGETFTDDGQVRGEIKAVEGLQKLSYTFTADRSAFFLVGALFPSMASSSYVDLCDAWKLEEGGKATSWSACPADPALELVDGSAISMTRSGMRFSGPVIDLNVNGADGDTHWDESGMTIPVVNSPSVPRRYSGPATLTVSPSATPDGVSTFRTLTDAFAVLSNKYIDREISITVATNTNESDITLRNLSGGPRVFINGNSKTIAGRLTLQDCTALVRFDALTINCPSSSPANGEANRFERMWQLQFAGCTFNANGASYAVATYWGSTVYATCAFYRCGTAVAAYTMANVLLNACKGTPTSNCIRIASAAFVRLYGSVRPSGSLLKYEGSSYINEASAASGGTPPSAPTSTATVSPALTSTRTYQSGGSGWLTNTDTIQQGLNAGYQHFAVIQFSTSGWAGKTIASGALTIHRLSGGKGGPITVKLMTTSSAPGSGTPTGTYTNHGVIGTIDRGETATFSIPAAALQEIASGTRTSLMLYDNGSAWGGRTFSENYAMFSGSGDATSAYRPKLSVTYNT